MNNTNIFHKRILRKLKIEALSPNDQLNKSRKCLSADSRQDFKAYNHVFKRMMRDKRITNIAVTGEFGVGKSSIIRSADRNTFPRHRSFLYVSLVDFYNIYDYSAGFDKNENENKTEDGAILLQTDSEVSTLTEAISSLTRAIGAADKNGSEDNRKNSKQKLSPKTKDVSKTDAREDFIYCFLNQLRSKYSSVRMRRFIKGTVSLSLALFIILGLWLYSPSGANGSASVNDVVSSIATADVAQPEETSAEANGANQTPNNGSNDNTTASPAVPEQNISEYSFKNYINGLSATLLNVPYYLSQLLGRIAGKTDGGVFACTKHECNFYGVSPLFGLFAIMLLYYGVWQVLKLIRLEAKMKELNLKFFDVDAKLSFVSQDLPIEKSCPEIISILKELSGTIKNTVIFDDMDRLGKDVCYSLLTKLREINHILNTRTRKTVRFVYPLNNDIYEISRGTKFFDAMIPVISRVDKTNAGDYLFGLIWEMTGIELRNATKPNAPKGDITFDGLDEDVEKFGNLIGACINDYRSIHQILNELVVLTKRGPKVEQCDNAEEIGLDNASKCRKKLLENLSFALYKNLLPEDIGIYCIIEAEPARRVELIENRLMHNIAKRDREVQKETVSAKSENMGNLISFMLKKGWLSGNEFYSLGHVSKGYEDQATDLLKNQEYENAAAVLSEAIENCEIKKYGDYATVDRKKRVASFMHHKGVCLYYQSIESADSKAKCAHTAAAVSSLKEALSYCPTVYSDLYNNICRMLVSISEDDDDPIVKKAISVVKSLIDKSVSAGVPIHIGLDATPNKDADPIARKLEPAFVEWKKITGTDNYICSSAFNRDDDLRLGKMLPQDDGTVKTFMGELVCLTKEEYTKCKEGIGKCGGAWRLKDGSVKNNGDLMETDPSWDERLWRPVLTFSHD